MPVRGVDNAVACSPPYFLSSRREPFRIVLSPIHTFPDVNGGLTCPPVNYRPALPLLLLPSSTFAPTLAYCLIYRIREKRQPPPVLVLHELHSPTPLLPHSSFALLSYPYPCTLFPFSLLRLVFFYCQAFLISIFVPRSLPACRFFLRPLNPPQPLCGSKCYFKLALHKYWCSGRALGRVRLGNFLTLYLIHKSWHPSYRQPLSFYGRPVFSFS